MFQMYNKVLVLAPHTDDGELGCGATIAKLVEQGASVHYVAFSLSRESVPKEFPDDILATEVMDATAQLGIKNENVICHDFPVRKLNFHRQEILEIMIQLKNDLQPDLVLMPKLDDIHQDHETIAREGLRAFKSKTILSYELIWNDIQSNATAICAVDESHIKKKINALNQYKSQKAKGVGYLDDEFIYSMARVRGVQINKKYAEAFKVVKWVM